MTIEVPMEINVTFDTKELDTIKDCIELLDKTLQTMIDYEKDFAICDYECTSLSFGDIDSTRGALQSLCKMEKMQ